MSIKIFNSNDTWDDIYIDQPLKDKNSEKRKLYALKDNCIMDMFFKSPKLSLIFKPKFKSVKFSLQPYYLEKKAFGEQIKDIEKRIKQFCQIHYQGYKFKSIISAKKNETKTIKFYINNKCKVYDWKKNEKSLEDLDNNMPVTLLLKATHFWIYDNKIGLNISIHAIKYYPTIKDYDMIDFIDDEPTDIIFTPKYPVKTVYHCLNCQSDFCYYGQTTYNTSNIPPPPMRGPPPPPMRGPPLKKQEIKSIMQQGFIPNPTDLLNMRNKLKKIEK
jgi:hypothetical protein